MGALDFHHAYEKMVLGTLWKPKLCFPSAANSLWTEGLSGVLGLCLTEYAFFDL